MNSGIIDVLLRKYGGVAGRKEARAMVFCQVGLKLSAFSTRSWTAIRGLY